VVTETFAAQFGEDIWMHEHLELPAKGVFVDVGASDGITKSNTYFLERRGWTGVCIDPDPRHATALLRNRNTVELCAVAAYSGKAVFYMHVDRPTRSGIACRGAEYRPIPVKCEPLEAILSRHGIGTIDVLDIDVEGTELEAWNSFDAATHQPRLVIIEFAADRPNGRKEDILAAFAGQPYRLVHQTPANLLLLRHDAAEKFLWPLR
jgi:FkbM family methyltransferase